MVAGLNDFLVGEAESRGKEEAVERREVPDRAKLERVERVRVRLCNSPELPRFPSHSNDKKLSCRKM